MRVAENVRVADVALDANKCADTRVSTSYLPSLLSNDLARTEMSDRSFSICFSQPT